MKKPFVLIAAIVAVVGLGAVVAAAKETIKVGTSATLGITSDREGPKPDAFVGGVTAGKKGCEKGRTVTVTEGSKKIGSDKTDNAGRYKVIVPPPGFVGNRKHQGAVREKRITKHNGDKIVCEAATSNWIQVLPSGVIEAGGGTGAPAGRHRGPGADSAYVIDLHGGQP